tara:strand:+ start:806 stop:997 length:192 start_codon:yes stop_codon:yes gene_type:complete
MVIASIFRSLLLKLVPLNVNEKFDGLCLNNGINSFLGIELFPEIVIELIFIGNSWPNKEKQNR